MNNESWYYQQQGNNSPSLATPHNTTDNDPDMRASTGSPSSADGDATEERPDLSFKCEDCNVHIDLRHLQEHRQYHAALAIMKYKHGSLPSTVAKLMQRRRAILKKLKSKIDSEKPIEPNVVQQINDAYELLKAHLEETFESFRRIRETVSTDVEGIALDCTVEGVLAIGMCSTKNERWKSKMEDAQTYVDEFGGDCDKAFIGVFDGHHGNFAANTAAAELHHALLYHMVPFDNKIKWNETVAAKLHSPNNAEDTWKEQSVFEDEGIAQDDGVCAIQQVIKDYEEKQERLKREREKAALNGDVEAIEKESETVNPTPVSSKKSARKKKYGNAYSDLLHQAFNKAYMFTDLLLSWGKAELSRVRWSGCSALTCIIENTLSQSLEAMKVPHQGCSTQREVGTSEDTREISRLHLAHAGNVQCLLIRGNVPYRLSKDHTARNTRERARVEKLGGTVSESEREVLINGVVPATHGLGNHGDMSLKRCVTYEPYTTVVPLDQYCELVVIATHGVWEVFSEEEAAKILIEMLPCNQVSAPSRLGTSIQYLLAAKSRSHSIDTSHVPASELYERLRAYSSMTAASVPLPDHLAGSPDTKRRIINHNESLTQLPEQSVDLSKNEEDDFSEDEDHISDESGNEADVDTNLDHMTIPAVSRMSIIPPTKDEVHREFAKLLSERLVQAALLSGAKDNISVTVIVLPGSGI